MSANDLDPSKLAGHGMPLLEIENLRVEIDGKLGIDQDMLRRAVNVGFSGGEKKRNEILQMAVLDCRASFAIYNTRAEVDILAQALLKAEEFFT